MNLEVPSFLTNMHQLTNTFLIFLRNRFSFMNLWSPATGPGNYFQLGRKVFPGCGVILKCSKPRTTWTLVKVYTTDGTSTLDELELKDGTLCLNEYLPEGTVFMVFLWCKRVPGGHENLYTLHGRASMSYPVTPPDNEEELANAIADFVGMTE